jgi:O-antigen/teichoic acid export membrane protein
MPSDPHRQLVAVAEEAAGGAFHLFWGGSLATVLSAIAAILVARLLGPEMYGVYSLALVVSGFLMIFTDFGVSQALTRYIALHGSRGERGRIISLLRAGLAFSLATSLIVFFVGFSLADRLTSLLLNRPGMVYLVRLTLILVVVQPLFALVGYALLGFGDMRGSATMEVVRQASRAMLSPLLIVLGLSVPGALTGFVIAYIFGFLTGLTLLYRHYRRVRGSSLNPEGETAGGILGGMLAYGSPLYLSSTIHAFAGSAQGVILAYFTTNFLIGNFNTAMNFAMLITLISSPVATALFPAFSRLGNSGGEAKTLFTYSVKYTAALIIPAAVFVSAMSRDLVFLVYGEGFSRAPLYLTLYAMTFLYAGLGSIVLGSFFSGVGDTRVILKATLLHVGLFIPTAVALTSILLVEGLLIAIMTASAASALYSLRVANRKYDMRVDLRSSAKICLAALLAAAPTVLLAQYSTLPRIANLAAGAMIYSTVYLTAVPLLGILSRRDLDTLTRIFMKVAILRPVVRVISSYEVRVMNLVGTRLSLS